MVTRINRYEKKDFNMSGRYETKTQVSTLNEIGDSIIVIGWNFSYTSKKEQ